MKCYKPTKRFFTYILEENGLSPQEILFVGDSIRDDILGPKAASMKTVWIDRNELGGDFGQDYWIADLNELVRIVFTELV